MVSKMTFAPDQPSSMHEFDSDQIAELSALTYGFSGRQIAKVLSVKKGLLAPVFV